eukprot:scaffold1459_cov260-Pinguiococcus_pyrenoidosus.AAC.12
MEHSVYKRALDTSIFSSGPPASVSSTSCNQWLHKSTFLTFHRLTRNTSQHLATPRNTSQHLKVRLRLRVSNFAASSQLYRTPFSPLSRGASEQDDSGSDGDPPEEAYRSLLRREPPKLALAGRPNGDTNSLQVDPQLLERRRPVRTQVIGVSRNHVREDLVDPCLPKRSTARVRDVGEAEVADVHVPVYEAIPADDGAHEAGAAFHLGQVARVHRG